MKREEGPGVGPFGYAVTGRSIRVLAAWLAAGALPGSVLCFACSTTVEDSKPPHDAGIERDASMKADVEAGPLLQCWCDGEGDEGIPMDHAGPHYIKCDAGWICGESNPVQYYCCPPLDQGIPNCDDRGPNEVIATPHGLQCKPPPW